jgi:hypothetical protein
MNERIIELEKQAWEFVDKTWNWANANNPSQATLFKTKFAELIVRECMKVCKKTEQYEVGNQDPDEVGCIRAGAVFCREDIKQHFGVEE